MKSKVLQMIKISLIIFLFSIPITLICINSELIVSDEIWNFQNIVKMINGNTIYVDCNVIITPIFYLIGYCFVKLITGTILGFRVYNIAIFLGLILSVFTLLRTLNLSFLKSFLYTLIILLFVMPFISVGANYNVLAETIFIFGIIVFLNKDKIKYYSICQGLIIFLCIFTKQNIGFLYLSAVILLEMILERKRSIRFITGEVIVTAICIIIAVLIMIYNGCFKGFLNYTVFGMGEFTKENSYMQGVFIIDYIVVALCSYILGFLLSKQKKEISKNIFVLSVFSILLNFTCLPIANLYHTSFAILLNVIIFIYILDNLLLFKFNGKILLTIIASIIYIGISSYGLVCVIRANKNIKIKDINNVYFSSNISEELETQLNKLTKYIKEKEEEGIDVVCISSDSALYMTYLNKNHQEFDLCFEGNLGYNGKTNIIEKIKLLENTEILINRDSFWQEVQELREYVAKNGEHMGSIDEVDIYVLK